MRPPAQAVSQASATPAARRTQAQRREKAEQRILDAAVMIIAARGLDALTLADAGTAAGFSRGLPVHYFTSKNHLVTAVTKYILSTYAEKAAERTRGLQGPARLTAAIDFYFDYLLQNSTVVRAYHIVLNNALNKPELRSLVEKIHENAVQELHQSLIRSLGVEDGRQLPDLRAQSALAYAMLLGTVAQWLVDPAAINLSAMRDSVISTLHAVPRE